MKTHSSAFNGLLSLIPAKYYYDDATQDQWQSKKKLKKEASKDRMAKLDPDSASSADTYNNAGASAKDVMENRSKTAKKVVVPGQKKETKEPKEPKEPKEQTASKKEQKTSEEDKNVHDDDITIPSGLVFDDEGNETEVPPLKKSQPKKELSPEEQQARQQRRAELREKLATKINTMREKRKAPGTKDAGPLRSREQMLAERKRRQEQKKEEKKRKREEMESDDDKSDDDDEDNEKDSAVLFGNIVFKDGSRVTSDLSKVRSGVDQKKKKGPSNNDVKAHLVKLEAKKRRLAELSPEEQSQQKEKDQWLSLMAQAEGVKVKDDEKLLKKTLKRKERQKLKSEIEWKERKQVVKDTISARQKRREANLKSRKDNKGKKSKNQPRLRKFTGVVKKGGKGDGKKRAGFEGSAKSKGDGKKRAGFEGSAQSKGKRK